MRHLTEKETDVIKLFNEYYGQGKSFIKGYAKERQDALEFDEGCLNDLKSTLSVIYLSAQNRKRAQNEDMQREQDEITREAHKLMDDNKKMDICDALDAVVKARKAAKEPFKRMTRRKEKAQAQLQAQWDKQQQNIQHLLSTAMEICTD